jgi:hypothetical protein
MSGLTWLHLSDWHQGEDEFDREVVLDHLLKDIRKRKEINPSLEVVDFVVFSGDLAYSGKPDQYKLAQTQFLQPILDECDLDKNRLFIVPGNHDIDIDEFQMLPSELLKPLTSDRQVQIWLTDDRKRTRLLEPFRAFSEFVKNFTAQEHPEYACVRRLDDIAEKPVVLLGLNSAWMCRRNQCINGVFNDYGYALMGEPQIQDCIDQIGEGDIGIAVFHHPFEWFAEFDRNRIETRLRRNCTFILNGHLHKPKVQFDFGGTLGNSIIIPTGACYNRRISENPHYVNSYNFSHLDFDRKGCIVFLRRWSDVKTEWIRDIESYADEGYCEFPSMRIAINQGSHPPPVSTSISAPSLGERINSLTVTISVSSEPSLQGSRYLTIQEAVDAAKSSDTIVIEENTYNENIYIDKSLILIGRGAEVSVINGNSNGSALTVGRNNQDIDVKLDAISLSGGRGSSMDDPWRATGAWRTAISGGGGILNYGRLTIYNSKISNNYAYEGGGIYNHGKLTLERSIVSNNKADFFGGGIVNMGTFISNSGEITDNKAIQGGGIANAGDLKINADSLIARNAATSGMGGGIWNRGKVSINDGFIEGNETLKDQNGYGGDGGGICNDDPNGEVYINGGVISGNSAWRGGGIYNYSGIVTMNAGSIENNKAIQDSHRYGGIGAGISNDGKFIMAGGSISSNIADQSGGGIYSYSGITIIKKGSISGNRAISGYGGGIYSDSNTVTFDDADFSIVENKAAQTSSEVIWYKGYGVFLRIGVPTTKGEFKQEVQIVDNRRM